MGTAYSTVSITGYNASPPPDDGSQSDANKVKWSTIKGKLPDPLKTAIESIDTKVIEALDSSIVSKTANYTTVAGDHLKTVEIASSVSTAVTISLGDAATMNASGMGYIVRVVNSGTGTGTVGRITAGNTIAGAQKNLTLAPKQAAIFQVSGTNYVVHNGNSPIFDGTDPSKSVAFDVSGVTTGTQRTLSVPDRSATIATLGGDQTFSGNLSFGGTVAVTGAVTFTSTLGVSDTVTITKSDNTSAEATHHVYQRGDGTGTDLNINTTGNTSNGVASYLVKFGATTALKLTSAGINGDIGQTTAGKIKATQVVSLSGTTTTSATPGAATTMFTLPLDESDGATYLAWAMMTAQDGNSYVSYIIISARFGNGYSDTAVNHAATKFTFGQTGGNGVYQVTNVHTDSQSSPVKWGYVRFGP